MSGYHWRCFPRAAIQSPSPSLPHYTHTLGCTQIEARPLDLRLRLQRFTDRTMASGHTMTELVAPTYAYTFGRCVSILHGCHTAIGSVIRCCGQTVDGSRMSNTERSAREEPSPRNRRRPLRISTLNKQEHRHQCVDQAIVQGSQDPMLCCQPAGTKPDRYCGTEKLNTAMTDHGHLFDPHPNLKVFRPFLDDLNRESERGAVLISVSYLERQLKDIVSAFLCEGEASERLLEGFNAPLGTLAARGSRSRRSRPHIRTRVPGAGNDQEDTQPVRPRSSHPLLGSGYRRSLPEPCLLSEGLRRCRSGFTRPIHHGRGGANPEPDEPIALRFRETPEIRELALLTRHPLQHGWPVRRRPNARETPCHD